MDTMTNEMVMQIAKIVVAETATDIKGMVSALVPQILDGADPVMAVGHVGQALTKYGTLGDIHVTLATAIVMLAIIAANDDGYEVSL